MSTRCQIGLYENEKTDLAKPDILIYRHCDGYPGTVDGKKFGVLPDIIPMLKDFRKHRGEDIEYCGAQLVYHLISVSHKHTEDFVAKFQATNGRKPTGFENGITPDYTGFGICGDKQFHWDIEYYYAVYPKTVKVYDVTGQDPKEWKKIKTVLI